MTAARAAVALAAALLVTACAAPPEPRPEPVVIELFDGSTLAGWEITPFGGEGEVEVVDGAIRLGFGSPLTGIHRDDEPPREDYELELTAARLAGTDFFCGLTFPIGASHATLVLGGWGGGLTGLSCIEGKDASENETTSYRSYPPGREFHVRVRVTRERVAAWIDDEPLFDLERADRTFSLRPEVLLSRPLGVAAYNTVARITGMRAESPAP